MADETIPSVKDLASSEPKLRAAAFKAVQDDLKSRQSLTYTQALQIWKGLFVMLYLTPSHPPLPHQRVVISVGNILSRTSSPSPETCVPLTTAFWETIAREWTSIDSHRMDKYLLLTRLVVRNSFTNILTNPSDSTTSDQLLQAFDRWPLATPETADGNFSKVSEGLRYHVLDCWVDELDGVVESIEKESGESEGLDKEQVELIGRLRVLVEVLSKGKGVSKGMRKRAKETVEDERWEQWQTK